MNILFLTRLYYPHIGGVEKHVYELSKELVKKGHKITIITERTPHITDSNMVPFILKNVDVFHIPIGKDDWFKKFRIWKWMIKNRKIILTNDTIHCHDVFFWYLPLAIFYPLKDVYTTFHGYETYPIKLKAILYRKVFEYMSNKTICVGDFMRKWYHAKPSMVIYGGVNIPKNTPIPQKYSAVFAGRLDEHTGIATYVDAVRLIRKKYKDFSLTIYGDGPLKSKLKRDGIIVKGYKSDVESEIGKYEIVFASRYLAILEAFAYKRPVFAVYDNPVKKDYLEMAPYASFIHISDTPEDVFEKVMQFYDRSGKHESIEKGYSFARKSSWNDIAKVYLNLWSKLK